MLALLIFLACLGLGAAVFLHQPQFGRLPDEGRLARIRQSPQYADGGFRNQVPTPMLAEDVSQFQLYREFFFRKGRQIPEDTLPALKTDLRALDPAEDLLVWLGHSSFYLHLGGKRIVLDPVLSPNASPFFFTTKAYPGTDVYRPEDLPDIDYVLISHDHWDHLDYRTMLFLRGTAGKVVCGLGVGAHLEHWGFAPGSIIELDWSETAELAPDLTVHAAPARHFSGRDLRRNRTLWLSFVLEGSGLRLLHSGDSGYGPHFAEIGSRFGAFDLALMESGQYDKNWPNVHMTPEETLRAARELGTRALLPMHAGKFSISNHDWDEPFKRLAAASGGDGPRLLTPIIGEVVRLRDERQTFTRWWENLR